MQTSIFNFDKQSNLEPNIENIEGHDFFMALQLSLTEALSDELLEIVNLNLINVLSGIGKPVLSRSLARSYYTFKKTRKISTDMDRFTPDDLEVAEDLRFDTQVWLNRVMRWEYTLPVVRQNQGNKSGWISILTFRNGLQTRHFDSIEDKEFERLYAVPRVASPIEGLVQDGLSKEEFKKEVQKVRELMNKKPSDIKKDVKKEEDKERYNPSLESRLSSEKLLKKKYQFEEEENQDETPKYDFSSTEDDVTRESTDESEGETDKKRDISSFYVEERDMTKKEKEDFLEQISEPFEQQISKDYKIEKVIENSAFDDLDFSLEEGDFDDEEIERAKNLSLKTQEEDEKNRELKNKEDLEPEGSKGKSKNVDEENELEELDFNFDSDSHSEQLEKVINRETPSQKYVIEESTEDDDNEDRIIEKGKSTIKDEIEKTKSSIQEALKSGDSFENILTKFAIETKDTKLIPREDDISNIIKPRKSRGSASETPNETTETVSTETREEEDKGLVKIPATVNEHDALRNEFITVITNPNKEIEKIAFLAKNLQSEKLNALGTEVAKLTIKIDSVILGTAKVNENIWQKRNNFWKSFQSGKIAGYLDKNSNFFKVAAELIKLAALLRVNLSIPQNKPVPNNLLPLIGKLYTQEEIDKQFPGQSIRSLVIKGMRTNDMGLDPVYQEMARQKLSHKEN